MCMPCLPCFSMPKTSPATWAPFPAGWEGRLVAGDNALLPRLEVFFKVVPHNELDLANLANWKVYARYIGI